MPLLPFWVLRLLDWNYKDSSFLLSDTRIGIEIILYLNKDRAVPTIGIALFISFILPFRFFIISLRHYNNGGIAKQKVPFNEVKGGLLFNYMCPFTEQKMPF